MAALTNLAETAFLELLLKNTDWANVGDATGLRGSTAAGSFHVALFTASPTDTGDTTNEATYGSYARVAIARSGSGWAVTNDTGDNVSAITFPEATSGSQTISHWGLMTASSGGDMIAHGAVTTPLAVSVGITPQFNAGAFDLIAA